MAVEDSLQVLAWGRVFGVLVDWIGVLQTTVAQYDFHCLLLSLNHPLIATTIKIHI